jgi:hypothetical protein
MAPARQGCPEEVVALQMRRGLDGRQRPEWGAHRGGSEPRMAGARQGRPWTVVAVQGATVEDFIGNEGDSTYVPNLGSG